MIWIITLFFCSLAIFFSSVAVFIAVIGYPFVITDGTIIDDIKATLNWKKERK